MKTNLKKLAKTLELDNVEHIEELKQIISLLKQSANELLSNFDVTLTSDDNGFCVVLRITNL